MGISKGLLKLGKDMVLYMAESSAKYSKNEIFTLEQRERYKNCSDELYASLDNWCEVEALQKQLSDYPVIFKNNCNFRKSPLIEYFFGDYIKKFPKFCMNFSELSKQYKVPSSLLPTIADYCGSTPYLILKLKVKYKKPSLSGSYTVIKDEMKVICEDSVSKIVCHADFGTDSPFNGMIEGGSTTKYSQIKRIVFDKEFNGIWYELYKGTSFFDNRERGFYLPECFTPDDTLRFAIKLYGFIKTKNKNCICDIPGYND